MSTAHPGPNKDLNIILPSPEANEDGGENTVSTPPHLKSAHTLVEEDPHAVQIHQLEHELDEEEKQARKVIASGKGSVQSLQEEIAAMKNTLKKIVEVQEEHIVQLGERFRLGDLVVTMKRNLSELFEDENYCIHFRGSCDRTRNHDLHGDVSGLHLRLTLRKRISTRNPTPILSGFIYFYPNVEEPGQTGISCKAEIEFWGKPPPGEEKESLDTKSPTKRKTSVFKSLSKLKSLGSPAKKEDGSKTPGGKTPTTGKKTGGGHTPNKSADLSIDEVVNAGWQKLFNMEHKYTNNGEGFGKWNVMVWEHFKSRVVLDKDGLTALRLRVSNIVRHFET